MYLRLSNGISRAVPWLAMTPAELPNQIRRAHMILGVPVAEFGVFCNWAYYNPGNRHVRIGGPTRDLPVCGRYGADSLLQVSLDDLDAHGQILWNLATQTRNCFGGEETPEQIKHALRGNREVLRDDLRRNIQLMTDDDRVPTDLAELRDIAESVGLLADYNRAYPEQEVTT